MTVPKKTPSRIRQPKFLKKAEVAPKPKTKLEQAARLEELLKNVSTLKSDIGILTDEMKEAQTEALEIMERSNRVSYDLVDGPVTIHATVVKASRVALDEGSLQKKIGATMWNKVTTRVLDRKKLDAYVSSGEIDPMVVASATTEVPNAPFIKITRK